MPCDCNLEGSLIIDLGSGSVRRSKPYPRRGASAIFSLEVLEKQATASLEVEIRHKNIRDTTWTSAGTFSPITTTGVHTKHITGIKELYHWSYKVDESGDPGRFLISAPQGQFFPQ